MALTLNQSFTAVVPGASFPQFAGSGGTTPYVYSVVQGGAGGTINSSTGAYTAPIAMTAYPATSMYDTIMVTDAASNTATAQILVATPLFLICDILQTQLGLPAQRVWVWDQKLFQPTDSNLYIAVSLPRCKPFGNVYEPVVGNGSQVIQWIAMYGQLDLDIISRGPAARDQKEFVVMALNSTYAQQQQDANAFYISKVPIMGGFVNLSQIDGAAIPYRYKISFGIQYSMPLVSNVPYYNTFENPSILTNA